MKNELKSVTVSSFQNLAENQQIKFDGPGMYGLIGKNLDDGGSNASGKSALTRAITVGAVGLGYVGINSNGLKNRKLGIAPKIVEEWNLSGKNVVIDRTIGGKLTVTVDGIDLVGKSDEIQTKLNVLFGMSPEHLIHLTHKMQESFGGFLLMKDADKKDFLGSFFETASIDKASAANDGHLKDLSKKNVENSERLRIMIGQLGSLKTEVDALTQKVAKYTSTEFISTVAAKKSELTHKELELDVIQSTSLEALLEINPDYQKMMGDLNQARAALESSDSANSKAMIDQLSQEALGLETSINSPIAVPGEMMARLTEVDGKLSALKAQQLSTSRLQAQKATKEQEVAKLQAKASGLAPDVCSTCGQSVSTEIFKKIQQTANDEIVAAAFSLAELNRQLEHFSGDSSTESDLNGQKNSLLSDIAAYKASQNKDHLKSALANVRSRIQLENAKRADLERAIQSTTASMNFLRSTMQQNYNLQLGKLSAELSSIKKDIQALEQEATNATTMLTGVNLKYQEQADQVVLLEQSISQTSKELLVRNKVSEILSRNGFIGYIFDTILEEINSEVNENIKQIPVISRLSMYFTPDKTVKTTGAVNKNITYNIFDFGDEISFETLSGSEKESLLAAVDVAVDTILCYRLGIDINYKILDEQFGWVDGDNKEHLLEFIKNKYRDKIVMIVDHGSELNAAIDKKITVTKQNGIATVSCQSIS